MSLAAIRVEGIGKEYDIGDLTLGYHTLRDTIVNSLTTPLRRVTRWARKEQATARGRQFWALRDISFSVTPGEVIGIIGRNGAGKSTLLKILARITEPSEGHAEIHGRVRALLEVGTGFHPELTGRENIFLNGAILGMPKAEIKRKFDEIVAFSEIEQFLDTPVKRYSSGMFVRLAFSVAAHLEPEILIIDEVLSVGDVSFQRKCLGKIGEVSRGGRTVVFVTHNMASALHHCKRGILLEKGRAIVMGDIQHVVDTYLSNAASTHADGHSPVIDLRNAPGRRPGCPLVADKLELFTGDGTPLVGPLAVGAALRARISFHLDTPTENLEVLLGFSDLYGQRIFSAFTNYEPTWQRSVPAGQYCAECEIPSLTLIPGEYRISVVVDGEREASDDVIDDAARFTVVESDYYGTGKLPRRGVCVMPQRWVLEASPALLTEK